MYMYMCIYIYIYIHVRISERRPDQCRAGTGRAVMARGGLGQPTFVCISMVVNVSSLLLLLLLLVLVLVLLLLLIMIIITIIQQILNMHVY